MDIGILVAIISAATALIGHWYQQYLARRNELRAKRVQIYTELLQATQDALARTKSGEQVLRDTNLTTRLIAWATSDVIIAFTDVWQTLEGIKHEELEPAVAKLLASIRKEFGHDDRGARFDELIAKIYVPNPAAQ